MVPSAKNVERSLTTRTDGRTTQGLFFAMENLRRLLFLILAAALYMVFGALVFQMLEKQQDWENYKNMTLTLQKELAAKYNMSGKEFAKVLNKFREVLLKEKEFNKTHWTFYSSLYFVGSVVTTIGYGHISPRSDSGRLFLLFFATIGIPLCVITLKSVGDRINSVIAACIKGFEMKLLHREARNVKLKQMIIAALLMLLELLVGGLMYHVTEDWNYTSSVYYCFVVFSTIGFGDLVPNQGRAPSDHFALLMMLLRAAVVILGLTTLSSLLSAVVQGMDELNVALPCCKGRRNVGPMNESMLENGTNNCDNEGVNGEQNNFVQSARSVDETQEPLQQRVQAPSSAFAQSRVSIDSIIKSNNLACANHVRNTWEGHDPHMLSPAPNPRMLSPVAKALISSAFLPCGPLENGDPLLHKENRVNALLSAGGRFLGSSLKLPPIQRRHSNIELFHATHSCLRSSRCDLSVPPFILNECTGSNDEESSEPQTTETASHKSFGKLFEADETTNDVTKQ